MQIRRMTIDDYDQVYALWLNTPGMGLNDLDDSREGIGIYLNRNPDTCFVVEQNQRIVGAIISGHDGRRGIIYHTAVAEAVQRQGIGKALLEEALRALKNAGVHKVFLVVFEKNAKGNAFWERQGFIKRDDLIYRNKALSDLQRIDT